MTHYKNTGMNTMSYGEGRIFNKNAKRLASSLKLRQHVSWRGMKCTVEDVKEDSIVVVSLRFGTRIEIDSASLVKVI